MRLLSCSTLAAAFVLAACGCGKKDDAPATAPAPKADPPGTAAGAAEQEAKNLQGTWTVVSFNMAGEDQTASGPKQIVISGDEFRGLAPNSTFRVDPSKTPKTLDLINKANPKKVVPLIYELKGDDLRVVFPLVPQGKGEEPKRPDGFETKDKPLALVVARRAKADAAAPK